MDRGGQHCPMGIRVNERAGAKEKGRERDLASEATSREERERQTKPLAALTRQNKEKRCIMGV